MKQKVSKRPWWRRILKYLSLTFLAIVLLITGFLVATVSILTPERLTPIVNHAVTRSLQNAVFEADTVRLSLRKTFPYMQVDVHNMRILSTIRATLPDSISPRVPQWADTVVSVRHLSGGINIGALALNTVSLNDITIDSPGANAVVVNDSITNFDIIPPSDEPSKPFEWNSLPKIKIKRFEILNPKPIRYFDVNTGTTVNALLDRVALDGKNGPMYQLNFGGDISSSVIRNYLVLDKVAFGFDGDFVWDQQTPWLLSVKNMALSVADLGATVNTELDFHEGMRLNTLDIAVDPIDIDRVLALIPDSVKIDYGIPEGIQTTARLSIVATLTEPYSVGGTALPHGVVSVVLPDSRFEWKQVHFDNMAADVTITMPTDNFDDLVFDIKRLHIQGPATGITLSGRVSTPISDPAFDGSVKGSCDLSRLPPVLSRYIPGSVSGRLTADAHIKGRPTMLTPTMFHRLHADGEIALNDFYWLGPDTINMVYATRAVFSFGTNTSVQKKDGQRSDSLLTTKIVIDSAAILHSDISMSVTDFSIGLGVVNRKMAAQYKKGKRAIVPMGGGIHIGKFNLLVLTDSALVRLRDVSGTTILRSHDNDINTPEFEFDLTMRHLATGDTKTRLLISRANTHVIAYREPQGRISREIAVIQDSLIENHPEIPRDSVYAIALEIHNRHHKRLPRVHPTLEPDSTEIITWGTSNSFRELLTQWHLAGSLTAKRASLFTPMFPIRNRLQNLNVTFNNDTVSMNNLQYKAGHSDFTLSGRITNLRRALTSRNGRSPLRINLALHSDTIDVNQLAETAFAGAAYVAADESDRDKYSIGSESSEEDLERAIGEHVANAPDSMAPLLIPRNIEAEIAVHTNNLRYSDLLLHNMSGRLLTYQGALSLDNLTAYSDVGSVNLSALYNGRSIGDMYFGFGLDVKDFNIHRFLDLVPPVDSLMPLLRDFSGIISAEIAATSKVKPSMDLDLSSLDAAIRLSGDSLVLIDPETFKSLSKWLLFRDKDKNVIDHMSVQMLVRDNNMQMFPFIFDIDRYRLGVQGSNDFDLNFNYHIAVLKSPIPFKFGINVSGTPEKYKIRLGGAKFDDKTPLNVAIVDTTRHNLIRDITNVFKRGVDNARFARLSINPDAANINLNTDTLTHLDSLRYIQEGLIPAPEPAPTDNTGKAHDRKSSRKKNTPAPSSDDKPQACLFSPLGIVNDKIYPTHG